MTPAPIPSAMWSADRLHAVATMTVNPAFISRFHSRRRLFTAWLLFALVIATPARSDDHTGLRRASVQLIPAIGGANIEPPLPKRVDFQRCLGRQAHATWVNPFSPLPPALRPRHVRLTGASGPAQVSFHDAFLVEPGHAFAFEIIPEHRPRLEFGWRGLACGGRVPELEAIVTVESREGTWTRILPLVANAPAGDGRRYSRMHSFSLDLPLEANVSARLTLGFRAVESSRSRRRDDDDTPTRGSRGPVIALAEPVITGIPDPAAGTLARILEHGPSDGPAVGHDLNVLWIVIDAVRRDALGPLRIFEGADVTPNLDAVFARGTSFTHAYTLANQTRTSTVAMLASTAPSIGGFHSHTWGFTTGRLDNFYRSDPPLVTRVLERHGWRVGHFGHNLFVFAGENIGVDHGFPYSVDFKAIPSDAVDASAFAKSFFEANRDRRWALMLNYTAPHTPYKPPEEFAELARKLPGSERLGGILPRNYIGELMWVDYNLGPVFKRLDELGLRETTLVIVTADHGEVMQPAHDCFSALVGQPCGFNHSLTVYDDELRVPLVFALPGRIAEGHVVETPMSHADLAPTILDLLGLPAEARQMGRSLRPAFVREPLTPHPIVADGRLASAFVHEGWKLIVHSRDDDISPRARAIPGVDPRPLQELFNLVNDPNETRNLAAFDKTRVEAMMAQLRFTRRAMRTAFVGTTTVDDSARPAAATIAQASPAGSAATSVADDHRVIATLALRVEGGPDGGELAFSARPVDTSGNLVEVPGLLVCTAAGTGCRAAPDGGVEGSITAGPGGYAEVRVGLSGAALRPGHHLAWSFQMGGETWAEDRLRLGYWGLAYFRGQSRPEVRALVKLARTDALPLVQPREPAIYLTAHADGSLDVDAAASATGVASPPSVGATDDTLSGDGDAGLAPEDGVYDRRIDQQLGRDMRKVLRELGYTR